MTLIPQNDYVVCEKIDDSDKLNHSFYYAKEEFPLYKIISVGKNLDNFRFNVNDEIVCNSTGTKVNLDNSVVYLFKSENIIGKVD